MIEKVINKKGYLSGLITGGVIGGLAALLFTPKSGKELRKNIGEKTDVLLDSTNQIYENVKDKASEVITDTKEKAGELIDSGKKMFSSASETTGDILSEGKDKLESVTDKAKDYLKQGKEELTEGVSKVNYAVKTGLNGNQEERNSKKDNSTGYKNTYNEDRTKNKKQTL